MCNLSLDLHHSNQIEIKSQKSKMEEDEYVDRMKNVLNWKRFGMSLEAITTNTLSFGNILKGISSRTIAFFAIVSSATMAAGSQFNGNDLDGFIVSDTNTDYSIDLFDKRIYHNLSINTTTIRNAVTINDSDSDNINENVTMASLSENLLVAAVTSTFNSIKSNDSSGMIAQSNFSTITEIDVESTTSPMLDDQNNYWALSALFLVVGTAAGNILVCLAIAWERRLQNVTNYFLMSLAITDLFVAILVMPLGILTLVKGKYKVIFIHFVAGLEIHLHFVTSDNEVNVFLHKNLQCKAE